MKQRYLVVFEKDHAGFSVFAPDFTGCFSQGDNLEDARINIVEAMSLVIEYLRENGFPIPEPKTKQVLLPVDGDASTHSEYATEWLEIDVPETSRPKLQAAA